MGHHVNLLVGPKAALRRYIEAAHGARMFALTPSAPLFVLPLTDAVHEALHALNGTGEWLDSVAGGAGLRLTSTDMDFAAAASRHTALAWLTTGYSGGQGEQAACVWIDGEVVLKPALLRLADGRPASLRPINTALRLLGVKAGAPAASDDEFDAFGLPLYRSNDAILERAIPVAP